MSPRERRLVADQAELSALAEERNWELTALGDPAESYRLTIKAPGVALDGDGSPTLIGEHRFSVYLHTDYPRLPPIVQWLTPIFHPNILPPDRHGAVCIGSWSPSESLADLVARLVDLATYRAFNLGDVLNPAAADWARSRDLSPGQPLAVAFEHA